MGGGQNRVHGVGGVELEGNEFALALNMALTLLVGLSYVEPLRWVRYLLRILAVFCATAVVGTFSRSGFLGLAIALLLLVWHSKWRVLSLTVLALTVVLLVPFIPEKALERYKSIPTAAEQDPSAISRIQTWETGLQMVKAHPLVGVGPYNFQAQYSHYFLAKYLGAANYRPRAPHNAYVALAAESGLPSLFLFLTFIGSAIWQMSRLRKQLLEFDHTRNLRYYCLTIQLTLMVYLVPNLFINRQNEDLMYHLVGMSVGLAVIVRSRLAEMNAELDEPAPQNL